MACVLFASLVLLSDARVGLLRAVQSSSAEANVRCLIARR